MNTKFTIDYVSQYKGSIVEIGGKYKNNSTYFWKCKKNEAIYLIDNFLASFVTGLLPDEILVITKKEYLVTLPNAILIDNLDKLPNFPNNIRFNPII